MDQVYERHGVRFRFPGDWELTEESDDTKSTITVSSPDTSFWSLALVFADCQPEQLIEAALDAFRDEYTEIDVYEPEERAEHIAARDVEFVCMELINGAFLRAFQTPRFTALVFYQGTDDELEKSRDVMEAISASLEFDGGRAFPGPEPDDDE